MTISTDELVSYQQGCSLAIDGPGRALFSFVGGPDLRVVLWGSRHVDAIAPYRHVGEVVPFGTEAHDPLALPLRPFWVGHFSHNFKDGFEVEGRELAQPTLLMAVAAPPGKVDEGRVTMGNEACLRVDRLAQIADTSGAWVF